MIDLMIVTNETDYPTNEVRRLVRFGMKGLKVKGVPVYIVKSRKHATGLATWGSKPRVIIRIPSADRFPMTGWRRHRSGPWNHDHQDWKEAIVSLSAHEGRHIDLHYTGRLRTLKTMQQIEMNCEAYQHGIVKKYRQVPLHDV